ncbi:conserved membrane hypothetical protein [groundwater metagenome]|uniref:Membrane-bound metal-dependent hydrolase n=1 Tax=groundwater metagenome TaxID=717931 RepID=A0A098EB43_9ZZZZ
MPLTPFHIGIGLALGMLLFRHINLPAILLASVIVDIEPIYCYFIGNCQLHGFSHTFIGGTLFAIAVIAVIFTLRAYFIKISKIFMVEQNYSLNSIVIASFVGVYAHLILDSFMHSDMDPFWPIEGNPLLGIISNSLSFDICIAGFFVGIAIYLFRLLNYIFHPLKKKE